MADPLSGRTSDAALGHYIVMGSATTSWISNNSPNSLDLSGLTEGLSYLHHHRRMEWTENESSLFDTWYIGEGETGDSTYGDDEEKIVYNALLGDGTVSVMYTEQARAKRMRKTYNRVSADNLYYFNRVATSANGFETFYGNDLSAFKYCRILYLNNQFVWQQTRNLRIGIKVALRQIWHD